MEDMHIHMNKCVPVWQMYTHSKCECTAHMCVSVCVCMRCTHTHLSRRVKSSPNGTTGTQDISILKGDISQCESCSGVQRDHCDSLTATQAGLRTDMILCNATLWEYAKVAGIQKTPVQALWGSTVMFSVPFYRENFYDGPHKKCWLIGQVSSFIIDAK